MKTTQANYWILGFKEADKRSKRLPREAERVADEFRRRLAEETTEADRNIALDAWSRGYRGEAMPIQS